MLKCKGFSLLETLIAITILSVGLLGVLGLITYTLSISRASPEEVIAVNLAQEGIEVVRNIRDSNWLAMISTPGMRFDQNIGRNDSEQKGSTVEYNDIGSEINHFTGSGYTDVWVCGSNCQIYLKNNFYSHDNTGTVTNFYRLIVLDEIDISASDNYIKVQSQVGWTDRSGNNHTITLEDHLYNWKQ